MRYAAPGVALLFLTTASALQPRPIRLPTRHAPICAAANIDRPTRPDQQGRIALATLAAAGAVETGTLTADKLWDVGALDGFCLQGGSCADVLSGPWSSVFGVPLSLLGFVAYSAMAFLAALPLMRETTDEADWNVAALMVGSGALASFSSCLMLLLLLVIREPCVLCFTSAALSASIFAVAWRTPLQASRTDAAVLAGSGAFVTLAAAVALFMATPTAPTRLDDDMLGVPPPIQTHSSERALQLARKLRARGGRFYGAYWCSHCNGQKQTLGAEAMKLVPYVECDANGVDSRRAECSSAGVKGYPTWELGGALYPGERDLDEIEEMLAGKATPQE